MNQRLLRERAERQFGLLCRRDLMEAGVSQAATDRRLELGEWSRLHRGVYRTNVGPVSLAERELGALLAVGAGAVLSHQSAARRLGLETSPFNQVQVTIPAAREVRRLDGVVIFRSRDLMPEDTTAHGPFRFTRLGRTLVDLASVLEPRWLRATLDSALRQRSSNLEWIKRAVRQHGRGRRGAQRLRQLVAEREAHSEVPDSVLESFAEELGLFLGRPPLLHCRVVANNALLTVDFGWPDLRLAIELDGWKAHSSHEAFTRDRERDRALHSTGWEVHRFPWATVDGERQAFINEVSATYRRRAMQLEATLPKTTTANTQDGTQAPPPV